MRVYQFRHFGIINQYQEPLFILNQARQCTTGNTQGLLAIPKQLSDVNKKVAPGISTFTPNSSFTVPQVYLGLIDKNVY